LASETRRKKSGIFKQSPDWKATLGGKLLSGSKLLRVEDISNERNQSRFAKCCAYGLFCEGFAMGRCLNVQKIPSVRILSCSSLKLVLFVPIVDFQGGEANHIEALHGGGMGIVSHYQDVVFNGEIKKSEAVVTSAAIQIKATCNICLIPSFFMENLDVRDTKCIVFITLFCAASAICTVQSLFDWCGKEIGFHTHSLHSAPLSTDSVCLD
jgi:hypothetical protein